LGRSRDAERDVADLLAGSAQAWASVSGQALPPALAADPDLGDRHAELRIIRLGGGNDVRDHSQKNCHLADDRDVGRGKRLRTPHRHSLGVPTDVLIPVEDLSEMGGPAEPFVEQLAKSRRVASRKSRCPSLCGPAYLCSRIHDTIVAGTPAIWIAGRDSTDPVEDPVLVTLRVTIARGAGT